MNVSNTAQNIPLASISLPVYTFLFEYKKCFAAEKKFFVHLQKY